MRKGPCYDHEGREYASVKAMCSHYGIPRTTYLYRIANNWPLQDALTTPPGKPQSDGSRNRNRGVPCKGPDGRQYPSISAMCADYGIRQGTFSSRTFRGATLRQALGLDPMPGRTASVQAPVLLPGCEDHDGTDCRIISAICEACGVRPGTFRRRLARGATLRQALGLEPMPKKHEPAPKYKGPDGKGYQTVNAMCDAYGVKYDTFRYRKRHGATLRQALGLDPMQARNATPGRHGGPRSPEPCTDHEGHTFASRAEMCRHWNVDPGTYQARIRSGMDVQTALTLPPRTDPAPKTCSDGSGRVFPSVRAMCREHGIDPALFRERLRAGKTVTEALAGPDGAQGMRGDSGKNGTERR